MITKTKRLRDGAELPRYSYSGDAGMDLHVVGDHILNPGESRDLPTGVAIQTPAGYWGRITGRSSTSRRGIFVNEGVIDEGYRGELLIYVTNRNGVPVEIAHGERLAQLILQEVVQAPAGWADELDESTRGAKGFGSTGISGRPEIEPERPAGPVYLGGAVDVGDDNHKWRHAGWPVSTYCPICSCHDLTDPDEIIARNNRAIDLADECVFVLNAYSVGTPIEAWRRIAVRGKSAILVVPAEKRGVFVEFMAARPYVQLVESVEEAMGLL